VGGSKDRAVIALAGRSLVTWLSPEAIEAFLGVLEPARETVMTTWTVAGQIAGESPPGLWIRVQRVLLPDGREMPLHEEPVCFLRWDLVTTARLYDVLPEDIRRIG
jgi:hypothetical protein